MRFAMYLSADDVHALELEVISQDLKVFLTRVLQRKIQLDGSPESDIVRQNEIINMSRSIAGLPIHVLEGDLDGCFDPAEYAWQNGEFQLVFRRLSTLQFIEFAGDLIHYGYLGVADINKCLEKDNASFRYANGGPDGPSVEVLPLDRIGSETSPEHPNIRMVADRMDDALRRGDYAEVVHASAVIFETMAKDIVRVPTVQNQTLKSFFERYRQESQLPNEILDFILDVYELRNTEPLAGHGSTEIPSVNKETAVTLCEMTKAFVKIEYKLHGNTL